VRLSFFRNVEIPLHAFWYLTETETAQLLPNSVVVQAVTRNFPKDDTHIESNCKSSHDSTSVQLHRTADVWSISSVQFSAVQCSRQSSAVSAEKSPVDGWVVDDRFLGLFIHSILVHSMHFVIIKYWHSFKETLYNIKEIYCNLC
jgi:hypothetical protein